MSKRPYVGVGVIVMKGDQVLLLRRSNSHGDGTWSSPGGHLEYGESPEACAIRETQEETGVIITDVTFQAITNDLFEREEKHYVTLWMEGRYVSGEPRINSQREMSEIGWFSWDALPRPLFLPLEHLLEANGVQSKNALIGERAIAQLWSVVEQSENEVLSGFSEQEKEQLLSYLKRIQANCTTITQA